ncbi:unnamed protein product, partial [Owenia fusiformis]
LDKAGTSWLVQFVHTVCKERTMLRFIAFLALFLAVTARSNPRVSHIAYRDWVNRWQNFDSSFFQNANKDSADLTGWKPAAFNFNCTVEPSPSPPTSVHALRPSDFAVVAAFGDSIMAGNGVLSDIITDVAFQNRHHSAYGGGAGDIASGVRTMPNVLKLFNTDLTGYSTDESSAGDPEAGMNVAVPGCTAHCMLDQATDLVNQMIDSADIDIDNDWKVVNILIGGNDLCRSCNDQDYYSAARYVEEIQNSIDHLFENSPRTLVNVVPMFDITPLPEMSDGIMCDTLHDMFCGCVTDDATRPGLKPLQEAYVRGLHDMVNSDRYETRDDFTVVIQTGLEDATPPRLPSGEVDRSFWSPDCFHPGTKAHYVIGIQLWNTMLQPVGQKQTLVNWVEPGQDPISCPTAERPYVYTRRNSS